MNYLINIKDIDLKLRMWVEEEITSKINNERKDKTKIDTIFAASDRWYRIKNNTERLDNPAIVLRRLFDITPNEELFLFKTFDNPIELYRVMNKEETKKSQVPVYDIVYAKAPTYIKIPYSILFYSKLISNTNTFQETLLKLFQKNFKPLKDTNFYLNIELNGPIDESTIDEMETEDRRLIVGVDVTINGFCFNEEDIKIVKSIARTKVDIIEKSFIDKTIDTIIS